MNKKPFEIGGIRGGGDALNLGERAEQLARRIDLLGGPVPSGVNGLVRRIVRSGLIKDLKNIGKGKSE